MKKRSSELVQGDIVLAYGLQVKLNVVESRELTADYDLTVRESLISSGFEPVVFWSVGTVLNYSEAIENGFPAGYLTAKNGEFFWTIQGNDRVNWTVLDK